MKRYGSSLRRLRSPTIRNEVFAVHKWETADGKHHTVHVWDKHGYVIDKKFLDWEDAELFAQEMAKKLGRKDYQVDTPSRPHTFVHIPDVRMKILKREEIK